MGLIAENGAQHFLDQQYIVVGPIHKFMRARSNISDYIRETWSGTDRGIGKPIENASHVKVSVIEMDTYIGKHGQDSLIRAKSEDQQYKIFTIALGLINYDKTKEDIQIPDSLAELLDGGITATLTTDVAGREQAKDPITRAATAPWHRVLNFYYSEKCKNPNSRNVNMMVEELLAFYEKQYKYATNVPVVRAFDSALAINIAKNPFVSKKMRNNRSIPLPECGITTGCETVGLLMERHPLADPDLRKTYIMETITRTSKIEDKPLEEVLGKYHGMCGGVDTMELHKFCIRRGIFADYLSRSRDKKEATEEVRQAVKGGSYQLFSSLLERISKPYWVPPEHDFSVHLIPSYQFEQDLLAL